MTVAARFRINTPHVVHEPFDDEIVLVNLTSGRYYCLQDSAATIWRLLLEGRSTAAVAAALGSPADTDAGEPLQTVTTFAAELQDQGLLVADDGEVPEPSTATVPEASPRPFRRPVLQVYTDMQDLLLLDPIHEVDEAGWPIARKETTEPAE